MKRLFSTTRARSATLDSSVQEISGDKQAAGWNIRGIQPKQRPLATDLAKSESDLSNVNGPSFGPGQGTIETEPAEKEPVYARPLARIKSFVHTRKTTDPPNNGSEMQGQDHPAYIRSPIRRASTDVSSVLKPTSKRSSHVLGRIKKLVHLGGGAHTDPTSTHCEVTEDARELTLQPAASKEVTAHLRMTPVMEEPPHQNFPAVIVEGRLLKSSSDVAESTASAAASTEEFVPRSISPAQFAELVDASIASEAAGLSISLNTSLSSVPTIETVLSHVLTNSTSHGSDHDRDSFALRQMACTILPPTELAAKILVLTTELPLPESDPRKVDVSEPAKAKDGRPLPPLEANEHMKDKLLAKYLRSHKVMNGSVVESVVNGELGRKESVWDALDALPSPWESTSHPIFEGSGGVEFGSRVIGHDSVMLCFPLIPTADAKVELAQFVVVSVTPAGPGPLHPSSRSMETPWPWPFKRLYHGNKAQDGRNTSAEEEDLMQPKRSLEPRDPPFTQRKVWVPSTTHLSLQATWWGYRIFLPPPILAILVRESSEASKAATIITTALTWLFEHLPTDIVPLSLQLAVRLLTRIIPFIGYIGAFIAWSISSIRSFDKGYGIQLTATWLLPVALIPSAMDPSPVTELSVEAPNSLVGTALPNITTANTAVMSTLEDPHMLSSGEKVEATILSAVTPEDEAVKLQTNPAASLTPTDKKATSKTRWSLTGFF